MAGQLTPATPQLTLLEETLEIIQDKLKCGICRGIYTDPKKLTCEHTFCIKCLQPLVPPIRCPYCRQYTVLPRNGAFGLQEDTKTQELFTLESTLRKFIFHTVQDSFQLRRKEITNNQRVLEIQITTFAEKLIATVNATKETLISELATTTHKKLQSLSAQEDQIREVENKLPDCWEEVKRRLQSGQQGVEDANQSIQSLTNLILPREQADIRLALNHKAVETCFGFGKLYADPVTPEKCTLEGVPFLTFLLKETTVTLQTYDRDNQKNENTDQLISCDLMFLDDASTVSGTVRKTGMGQYELSYKAPRTGCYQLQVKVEGQHIQGSPFNMAAVRDLTTPIKTTNDVEGPWGVAINNGGHIIVAEWGNDCISIIREEPEEVTSLSDRGYGSDPGQLSGPRGVAVLDDGSVVVADGSNHRIQKFSPQGELLCNQGEQGTGALQFDCPTSISVHPLNKHLYITDSYNHRIQVLDANLNYITKFGSEGSDNGELKFPWGVSFDSVGNCYVADSRNSRVQVFKNGQYLRQFGKNGEEEGEIADCTSIAIHSNIVYIADETNHRISLFTTDGCFLTSFGTEGSDPGQFNRPYGIYVDENGLVYVSDNGNNRIQVF